MKYCLALVLSICFSQALSQNLITNPIPQTIQSLTLKEPRELLIYSPSTDKTSKVRYPVLYLLDGRSFFEAFTGMVRYLSACGKIPQMIIVGIVNTDRVRDLTPTHAIHWSDGEKDEKALSTSGGGEAFTSFLEKELIPHIDSLYPTAPYRMIVGHSLGGLSVLNTLMNHPNLFTAYVTIDPTLWWDQKLMLKKASTVLAQTDYSGKKVFFASANTLPEGRDTLGIEQDTAHSTVHVRDNLAFRQLLSTNKRNHLAFNWKYYPDDNHASVPFIAGYDALRTLFKGYELPKELNDPELNAAFVSQHYQYVSTLLGYQVLPPESTINILGYENLSTRHYQQAYDYFRTNVANYPQSFNVYDSFGDYYLAVGDTKQAATFFRKALSMKDNVDTRKKLDALSRLGNQSK